MIQEFGFLLYTIYHFIENLWKIVKDFCNGVKNKQEIKQYGMMSVSTTTTNIHFDHAQLSASNNFGKRWYHQMVDSVQKTPKMLYEFEFYKYIFVMMIKYSSLRF